MLLEPLGLELEIQSFKRFLGVEPSLLSMKIRQWSAFPFFPARWSGIIFIFITYCDLQNAMIVLHLLHCRFWSTVQEEHTIHVHHVLTHTLASTTPSYNILRTLMQVILIHSIWLVTLSSSQRSALRCSWPMFGQKFPFYLSTCNCGFWLHSMLVLRCWP